MKTRWLFVVAGAALAVASFPATAADQDRDRIRLHDQDLTKDQDQLRTRLHDMLKVDASLTDAELADVDPAITGYAARNGSPRAMRETVRAALGAGCKGTCLAETIRAMNACVQHGETANQARDRVMAAVRERARDGAGPGSEAERGARIRERVGAQLEERARVRERSRDRDREKERDRDRDRERAREHTGTSAGPGPGPGK